MNYVEADYHNILRLSASPLVVLNLEQPENQGFDPGTARLVAQCLNHCATPGRKIKVYMAIIVSFR